MSLITIYGINASGKDAIASKLQEKNSNIFTTSESRLLMFNLGITNSYGAKDIVSRDQYKKLENTSQEEIVRITNTKYLKNLEKFRNSEKTILLLSHLVFLLHIDKEPVFLNQKDPVFPEISSGLIHIKSNPEEILDRRNADNASGLRHRFHSKLDLIVKHQNLCDMKWEKITLQRKPETYTIIENNNGGLESATYITQDFIKNL